MAEYSKLINLIKVSDGAKGQDGANGTSITIKSKSVTYQIGDNSATAPSGTWSETIPDISQYPEQFLWTRTKVEYSDGTETSSYSVSYIAKNGEDGKNGINGQNGRTLYTWIAYADDDQGTNASTIPDGKKYIGFSYNQRLQSFDIKDPNIISQFTWSLYKGESGESGIGIIGVRQLFILTDSSISTPNLPQPPEYYEWTDYNPEWVENKYLWICTEYLYSDGNFSFTTPYTDNNWKIAQDAVNDKYQTLEEDIKSLQNQIDSAIETWYIEGPPSVDIPPWGDVTENETHIGDLYYDTASGLSYRFLKEEDGTFIWKQIADSDISGALAEIEQLKSELDKKVTIFLETPVNPEVGDLWIQENGYFYQYTADGNWILANNGVQTVEVQYAKNQSNISPPTDSEFTTGSPDWESGWYIWQRTVIIFADGKIDKSEPVCISAAAAKGIIINGEQVFKATNGEQETYVPSSITLIASTQGDLKFKQWSYKDSNGDFQVFDATGNEAIIIEPGMNIWVNNIAVIKAESNDPEYYDIMSLYKVFDGADGIDGVIGKDGTSPPLVYLTNENVTFAANPLGQIAEKTITSSVIAFEGTTQVKPICGNITGAPAGMIVTVTENVNEIVLTITGQEGSDFGTSSEISGVVEIPVTYPVQATLKLNWTKVNSGPQGEQGEKGDSIEIVSQQTVYAVSASGTEKPAEWIPDIPETIQGMYLWSRTTIVYNTGDPTVSYTVAYVGKDGEQGIQGPAGKDGIDSTAYYLEANQPSILKFQQNNNIVVSPEILNLNIYKANSSKESGREQVNGLSIDNLTIKVFSNLKGIWYEVHPLVKQSIVTLNELGNTFNVDLKSYYEMSLESDDEALFTFIDEDCIFSFSYVLEIAEEGKNEKYNLSIYVNCNFAMTKDMVEFSQNAADITASIQSTKLKFSANGLEVANGGIQIKDNTGTQVLYADENGNLIIKGILDACGGSFSGDISAASGNFSGTINGATGNFAGDISAATGIFKGGIQASEGLIGGFKITQDSLISTDNEANPAIVLNGITGKIVAQNIELGTGAIIKDYIQLGSGKVTLNNSSKFLTVRKEDSFNSIETLSINDEGIIIIGNGDNMITIDGGNGIIKSQNYDNGLGWKISNKESIFNEVTVRGSIRASVLEYGEVQTVGGALIIRPSSRIKNVEYDGSVTKITLEDSTGFNIGDTCLINKDLNKIWIEITAIEENVVFTNQELSVDYIGHPLIDFGHEDENGRGEVGIGINGSTNGALITPTSLSVFDFDKENKLLVPHIILGKLPDDGYGFASGTYGLYAENVLLKGSLVTQTRTSDNQSTVYSGISTLYSGSDSPASHGYTEFFGDNTGEILLWAGATGTSKEEVENSKFFVDKNGNLVAKSGYFKGTIITDAQITASEIITAKLTGNGSGPALTISDAALGIVFQKTDKTTQTTSNIFVLSEDSITANVPSIVFNDNFKIKENGEVVISKAFMGGFSFTEGRINYSDSFSDTDLDGSVRAYIDFSNGIKLSPDNVKNSMTITATQVEINDIARFSNTIKYGVNDNMKYEPVYEENVLIGYDLYVD